MRLSSRLPSRYRLESSLGKGGFGEVHKAYDTELDKTIAIKILKNATPASKTSLKREFEVLSKLTHPHLVRVYGFGFISDDIPYYTMEYIEGEDLKTFLSSPSAIMHIPYIINQSLQALGYLHERQIIHGDIKPENIFISISRDNSVSTKILDFGLTSTIQDSSARVSGTPRFMAPEILSHREYSPASDLYALGITFIESITRIQAPSAYDMNTPFYKKVHNKLSTSLASQSILNPSAIASFILNLSDKDTTNRPKNAQEALKKSTTIFDVFSHDIVQELDNVFVERKLELEIIRDFIKQGNIDTRVLTLEGPTGIGKKALMRKAIAIAQPEGYIVLDLSDPSLSRNTMERFIEMISANLSSSKRDAFRSRHSKIIELVKTRSKSDKSLANNMLVAYSNIIDYLRSISGYDAILLSIPDIERFSEDFFQFIDQLIHELHLADTNVRLIISRNTDKRPAKIISDTLARSASLGYSAKIEVEPFTYNKIEELQKNLFNEIIFNKHQTQQIIKETDGTPLLIIEYIKHLLASGAIQLESGAWTLDQAIYAKVPIPGHIEVYINEEYSQYDRIAKQLLQFLAFWGRDISRDVLSELSGIPIDDIENKLMPLLDSMIIERSEDSAYRFKHDAYIKFIKRKTSKGRAININTSILDYLENTAPSDKELLAIHSIASHSIDKSMEYVFNAVDLLEPMLKHHRCYVLLSKLKALIKKHGNREQLMKVLDRIAPIELLIGNYDDALHDYEQLLNNADGDRMNALYSISLSDIHFKYFGDLNRALKYLDLALSHANSIDDQNIKADLLLKSSLIKTTNREKLRKEALELARNADVDLYANIASSLSRSYTYAGKHDEAVALREILYSLLSRVSPTCKKYIYSSLYNSTFYSGEYDKAKAYTEESIINNNELGDEFGLIENYKDLGGLYYIQGQFYDQINVLNIALNKLKKYNMYDCSFYFGNLSLAYRSVADYRKALYALEQAEYYYNNLIGKFATSWTLSKYNYYYVLLGNKEKNNFNKYLNKTISAAKRDNNNIVLGHTYFVKALNYYQRLQLAYSLRNIKAALAIFRKANDRDDIVDSLRLITIILIEKGDLTNASKAATEAREIFDEIHCDYLKPQLFLAEGALARAQQGDTAESKLKEALKTSKKMFTREYTWQIQRELALYYRHRGELHKALEYYRGAIDMIKEITETIDGEELKTSYLSLPFRKRVFDEIKALKKQLN